jgi:hypothetical protein
MRDIEADVGGRAGLVSPETQAAGRAALEHPALRSLAEEQAQRRIAAAPTLHEDVAASRAAMEAAKTAPAAVAQAPQGGAVLAGLAKQAGRQLAIPAAGATIGALTGEDPLRGGLAGGAIAAAGGSQVARPLLRLGQRALRNPDVQRSVLTRLAGLATTSPQALGKWGSYLSAAAARGPAALATTHYTLSQSDTEYAAQVRLAMDSSDGK